MTGVALVRGHRVCGRLISGVSPGMTSGATIGSLAVIERRDQRQEQIGGMTHVTGIRGERMGSALAYGNGAVVAKTA